MTGLSAKQSFAYPLLLLLCIQLLPACSQAPETGTNAPSDRKDGQFPAYPIELVFDLPVMQGNALTIEYSDGLIPNIGDSGVIEVRQLEEWKPEGRAHVTDIAAEALHLRMDRDGLPVPARLRLMTLPRHRCDVMSASELDEHAIAPAVKFKKIPVEAVGYCGQAVGHYPATIRFHFQLARALQAHRQEEAALARYRRVLSLDPDYAAAKMALAGMYLRGEGVERNPETARQFLEATHNAGVPRATYLLAQLTAQSMGANAEEVLRLERSAAEAGDLPAQLKMALRYEQGQGLSRSVQDAVYWYEQAAMQGDTEAQFRIGQAYAFGEGKQQSWAEARQWWDRAAQQDYAPAQIALGESYEHGRGLEQADAAKAYYWYRRAADQLWAMGQYHVGRMLAQGVGVEKNAEEARKWLLLARAQGVQEAGRWLPKEARQAKQAGNKKRKRLVGLRDVRRYAVKTKGYMDSKCRAALREDMSDIGLKMAGKDSASPLLLTITMSRPEYYQSRVGPFSFSGYRIQYRGEVVRRSDGIRLFFTHGDEDGDDKREACVDAIDEIIDDLEDAID